MQRILPVALFLTLAAPANADPYWSAIATSCVPDSVAIQGNRYRGLSDNAITMPGNKLDPITLICGVVPNNTPSPPNRLSMTYLDSTGLAVSGRVQAQLIRVTRNNGTRYVVATLNSNKFSDTTAVQRNVSFAHILNFNAFYYYVRLDLDRSLASETVRSIGVSLDIVP